VLGLRPWFVLRREPQQVGDGGGSHLIADQRNQVMASNQQFLIDGALPDQGAKDSFRSELARNRHIEPATMQALAAISPRIGGPLAGLRAAVSLIVDDTATLELSEGQRRTRVLRVIGPTPTVLAALYRLGRGETPLDADPSLSHAADYVPMVTGTTPSPRLARAIETYLLLTADHGFNASTFTTRVITSNGAGVRSEQQVMGPKAGYRGH
jgi:citrate synthase